MILGARAAGPRAGLARAACLIATVLLAGCGGGSTTSPGSSEFARLGMVSNPSDSSFLSPAFGDSITWALIQARDAGATVQFRAPQWNVVEPTPGVWNLAVEELFLGVHRTLGLATFVNLRVIDTNSRNVPPDLAALAWDDTTMIRRVDVLVDTLAALARRHDVVGVAIGNEVDAYFSLHPDEFPAFLVPTPQLDAHEDLGSPPIGIAVIELGDLALAQGAAEFQEAAGPFRDLHRQQGLPALAKFGTLGDMA